MRETCVFHSVLHECLSIEMMEALQYCILRRDSSSRHDVQKYHDFK